VRGGSGMELQADAGMGPEVRAPYGASDCCMGQRRELPVVSQPKVACRTADCSKRCDKTLMNRPSSVTRVAVSQPALFGLFAQPIAGSGLTLVSA
jgi:hypothetical protein